MVASLFVMSLFLPPLCSIDSPSEVNIARLINSFRKIIQVTDVFMPYSFENPLSNMEEERLFDERISICEGRQLKKYGSTSNHVKRQEELIKHIVLKGETLQGIALKYGVTTEKIRRANRLFASDSLFLREFLMIPVPKDSGFLTPDVSPVSPDVSGNNNVQHRASIAGIPSASNHYDFPPGSPDEKKTFDDFLSRVDTSLAGIKKDVERTTQKSEFGQNLEDYTRRRPTSRLRQSASVGGVVGYQQGEGYQTHPTQQSYQNCPPGETVVLAQGRHVRSSLQRLQRTQDDWFQL